MERLRTVRELRRHRLTRRRGRRGKGYGHATRNDWTGTDGGEHGAPADRRRPRVCRLRHVTEGGGGSREGEGRRRVVAGGLRQEALEAARDLADGAGGSRGPGDRRSPAASREGRHPDRWRKFLLRGRHPAGEGAGREGHPLRGRRHERRCLGARAGLLHDDRRRACGREAPRPDLQAPCPRSRRRRPDARTRGHSRHGRRGVSALRPERRRPLRQDGAQRHRVRPHGGLRRGPQHPEARQRW